MVLIEDEPNLSIDSPSPKHRSKKISDQEKNSTFLSSFRHIFTKNKPIKSKLLLMDSSIKADPETPDINMSVVSPPYTQNQPKPPTSQASVEQTIYSLSNLPLKTQCLLNSKQELEAIAVRDEEADHNVAATSVRAKDIKLYVTEPHTRFQNQHHHFSSIFSGIHESNYDGAKTSVLGCLESYCKKSNASSQEDTFDLSVIDLHCANSVNESDFTLKNKYFRRLLGKKVLHELLNVDKLNTANTLPSNCIFLVSRSVKH